MLDSNLNAVLHPVKAQRTKTLNRSSRKRTILIVALASLISMACASVSVDPLTAAARGPSAAFFVANHGSDSRGLERIIAEEIRVRGFQVTSGASAKHPASANFIVTYVDRWGWDMRTYLLEIKIEVRDTKTDLIVGSSRLYQDSLAAMGKSYEEIVREATKLIFDTSP